jgi:hypothetical protein
MTNERQEGSKAMNKERTGAPYGDSHEERACELIETGVSVRRRGKGILQLLREALTDDADQEPPIIYNDTAGGSIADQMDRYRELADHDVMACSIATLKARGTFEPSEHVNDEKFPPLTTAEHLEMLALGERIARYYRLPAQVDKALRAGATWEQIAAATIRPALREQHDTPSQLAATRSAHAAASGQGIGVRMWRGDPASVRMYG